MQYIRQINNIKIYRVKDGEIICKAPDGTEIASCLFVDTAIDEATACTDYLAKNIKEKSNESNK